MIRDPQRFSHGQWNAICDRCGTKYKSGQLRLEWTGLRVCSGPNTKQCWEPRHPQDFVRGKVDRQSPPWARPEPAELNTSTQTVCHNGVTVCHNGVEVVVST